MTVLQIHRTK